jgi:hypothetical protein
MISNRIVPNMGGHRADFCRLGIIASQTRLSEDWRRECATVKPVDNHIECVTIVFRKVRFARLRFLPFGVKGFVQVVGSITEQLLVDSKLFPLRTDVDLDYIAT